MNAFRRVLLVISGALLFASAIPLSYRPLERFMYWTSLMSWPGYEPLLYWFPMLLWRPLLWWFSLGTAVLAITAIAVLMRRRRFAEILLVLSCAISLALMVQYAAITRLDDHVFWFFARGVLRGLPWEFSWSALFTCLAIAAGYTAVAGALSAAVRFVQQHTAKT